MATRFRRPPHPVPAGDGAWALQIFGETSMCQTGEQLQWWDVRVDGTVIEIRPKLVHSWLLTDWLYGEPQSAVRVRSLEQVTYAVFLVEPDGHRIQLESVTPDPHANVGNARWHVNDMVRH